MEIWKYSISNGIGYQTISMPKGSKIISAATQRNRICVWAEVDPDNQSLEAHNIELVQTGPPGTPSDTNRRFIDTVMLYDGDLVLHVYEHIPQENNT